MRLSCTPCVASGMSSRWREGIVRTFGAQIALWYFGLFVLGALLVLVLAGLLLQASLRERDRDALAATLLRYVDAYGRGDITSLDRVAAADRAAGSYEPVFVRVLAGGRTRLLSVPVDWNRFDLERLDAPQRGTVVFQRLEAPGAAALEVASVRLGDGVVLQVGRSTALREAVLERYRETSVLLVLAIVLAALSGGLTITWRALQPLRALTRTITRIVETGRTDERVPVRQDADPLDALGTLVNRLLDRIDALVRGMRATLDNVAHDLRTPMTRLRVTAEEALHGERSPQQYRDALADCVEEADRVSAILDALMDIAEAEQGAMRLRRDTFDLRDVVRDAVELYEPVAEEKGLALHVEVPGGSIPITGDRARLTQALANVVDNAVKYTPAPGRVSVIAASDDHGAAVVVEDTGVGITRDELPRIWERLYRGDRSRSEPGLGIGLSLVRAIVEAHGGDVTAESRPRHGSRFRVWLPRDVTRTA